MRFGVRELIFLVVLLAVPAVSMLYVFKPRNDDISQALTEIELKQTRLSKLAAMTERIDDLSIAIEEGREAIRAIEEKLPGQQGVEIILQQVWEVAAANSLLVKSFKSDKPIPAADYREQPLAIEMEGTFDGFYRFLLELENLPRITRIHNLKLERVDTQLARDTHTEMKAGFTLSIYYEPEAMASAGD